MVSHHHAKLGAQRHCSSGDIMNLVCQVISKYYVIKGSFDLMGGSLSL